MNELIKNEEVVIANKELYLEKFLQYIDVSEKTAKEYKIGLNKFFESIENRKNITRQDVIDFRDNMLADGKSTNTINLYLVGVKSFLKWLEFEGVCKDISRNIKALPVEKIHTKEPFSVEEIKTLLDNCENLKEKIIIQLGITCGLRCNEMCNIRIQDFKIKQDKICLYVLGKARKNTKTDFVIVADKIFQSIKEYVAENNIQDYLFVSSSNNNKNGAISTNAMRNIVNKILDRAGLKDDSHVFHSMRTSFCNISLENGISLQEVSKSMRHSSITTTQHYIKDIEIKNMKCANTLANLIA